MHREILIIDDHDDLMSALETEFLAQGHTVKTVETRHEAVLLDNIENYDFVITDLDNSPLAAVAAEKSTEKHCLPDTSGEKIRAFKICATGWRRENFDEKELKNFVEIVLKRKEEFIDSRRTVLEAREKIEFEVPGVIALMSCILDYLIKRVEKVNLIDSANSNLFIALDEAFVNAVKHGNKFDTNKAVKISAEISPKEARFTVEDDGEGFDVNSIPDPLDPENLFKTSGRGVLIIKNVMDEVRYNERGNKVEMIKKKL